MVLIQFVSAVDGSNEQIVPSATDVSINGLHFDVTNSSGNLQGTSLSTNPVIIKVGGYEPGEFDFEILGYGENISEGIEKLKSDSRFDVPLSGVEYYNISGTTIDGWPAVVGAMKRQWVIAIGGFIYVGDYKIGFSYIPRDKNDLTAWKAIKITAEPDLDLHFLDSEGKPFTKDHLVKKQAECEAKCVTEYNESQSECGAGQCGDKRYYNICLADCRKYTDRDAQFEVERDISPNMILINVSRGGLYIAPGQFSIGQGPDGLYASPVDWYDDKLGVGNLEMMFLKNDSKGWAAAKTELTALMKSEVSSPSDITYLNVSVTMIGGWPAVVGVMNSSRHYTSGRSDLPLIDLKALIYVRNQKILAKINEVLDPARQYEQMGEIRPSEKTVLDKMRSIKITLAPGASWW